LKFYLQGGISIVIYACDHCHFTFSRVGDVEVCPSCDKPFVREATKKEKEEYKNNRASQEAKKNITE